MDRPRQKCNLQKSKEILQYYIDLISVNDEAYMNTSKFNFGKWWSIHEYKQSVKHTQFKVTVLKISYDME